MVGRDLAEHGADLQPQAAADLRRAREAGRRTGVKEAGARLAAAREALFEAWRRYFGAVAAVAPLVLIVEDIHWADDATLSFLDVVARWADGPIALVCLARHELLEVRAGGTTFGGFSQRSAPFRWPIDFCEGCLNNCFADADELENSCLPGQDWCCSTG